MNLRDKLPESFFAASLEEKLQVLIDAQPGQLLSGLPEWLRDGCWGYAISEIAREAKERLEALEADRRVRDTPAPTGDTHAD